jgi:hypothetical protein
MKESRRAKRRWRGKRLNRQPLGPPYTPVKRNLYVQEDPFGGADSRTRRRLAVAFGEKADEDFQKIFYALDKWPQKYDALYFLSYCFLYFLSSPGGIDREDLEGKLDFGTYHLELLQAFCLRHDRSANATPLQEDSAVLFEEMKALGNGLSFRFLRHFTESASERDLKKLGVLEGIRSFTRCIRNYSHPDQIARNVKGVHARITKEFSDHYSLDVERLIDSVLGIEGLIRDVLGEHLRKIGVLYGAKGFEAIWKAYKAVNPADETTEPAARKLFQRMGRSSQSLKESLIVYLDNFLPPYLMVTSEEVAHLYGQAEKLPEIQNILDTWSLSFGELKDIDPGQFLLDNPVLHRPFIRVDEGLYFFPLFGTLQHMLPNMMESLVKQLKPKDITKYSRVKAEYLEDETERLFLKAFPTGKAYRGSRWFDADGRERENDLLVVIDRFTFVIESKSGRFDPSARRGGELRIIDTLKELVLDAGIQANDFIAYLQKNRGVHTLKTKSRKRQNVVDLTDVAHFIPLSITYENLYTLASNLKQCIDAGLISASHDDVIPSLSIDDLEIVLDILANEVERIHYLSRRTQIDRDVDIEGDEMDLLAFYLDSGFNLGETEQKGNTKINLLMKSKEVDSYYTARLQGVDIPKPRLALTKWWRDILNRILDRKPDHWTEIGYVLLNVPIEAQRGFERKVKNMAARVENGMVPTFHNYIIMETAPKHRSYVIIGFPYTVAEYAERNAVMAHALSPENIPPDKLGALCIGISIEKKEHYPYSVIAYEKRSLVR